MNLQRNIFSISVIFLGLAANGLLYAQGVRLGVKGGLNVSKVYADDQRAVAGYHAGVFAQRHIYKKIALQTELLVSAKGIVVAPLLTEKSTYKLNYMDLPVLLVVKLASSVEIHAGGYASYLLSVSRSTSDNLRFSGTDKEDFNKIDLGLIAGMGFDTGKIQFGVRYNFGLRNLAQHTITSASLGNSKIANAQLFLSFTF
jgi:Outer membrane protein beta-barrel domain